MRQTVTNTPVGGMVKDTDARYLDPKDYVDALNVVSGYGTGVVGAVIPYASNLAPLIPATLDPGSKCIGAEADKQSGTLLYAIYSPIGNHAIYRYFPVDEFYTVLAQGSFLNFFPTHHVQMRVVDGKLLYWTDGTSNGNTITGNPPRMLNLERADNQDKAFEYELLIGQHDSFAAGAQNFADGTEYRIDFYDEDYVATGSFDVFALSGVAGDKVAALEQLTTWLNTLPTTEQVTATTDGKSIKFAVLLPNIRARVTSTGGSGGFNAITVPVNHYIFSTAYPSATPDPVPTSSDFNFMISRLKYQLNAPSLSYDTDASFNGNFVSRMTPQFTARYVYVDGEKSKWGTYSTVAIPTNETDNRIRVDFSIVNGSANLAMIKAVEFAVRYSNDGEFRLCKTMYRKDFQINPSNTQYYFFFYGNEEYPPIPSDENGAADQQVLGLFDYVPDLSGTEEIISDENGSTRVLDGAVKYGYDPVDTMVDIEALTVAASPFVKGIYKHNSRYEFGIVYEFSGGKRSTTNPCGVYISPDLATTSNSPRSVRMTIHHLPPADAIRYHIVRKKNLSYQRWKPLFAGGALSGVATLPVEYGTLSTTEEGFQANGYGAAGNTHLRVRVIVPQTNLDSTDDVVNIFPANDTNWFFLPSKGDRFRLLWNRSIGGGGTTIADVDFELDAYEFEQLALTTTPAVDLQVMYLYAKIDAATPNYTPGTAGFPGDSFMTELYTPRTADDGIFYEIYSGTLGNGFHSGNFQTQTALQPAIVDLEETGDAYWRDEAFPNLAYFGGVVELPDLIVEAEDANLNFSSKVEPIGKPNAEDPNAKATFYRNRFFVSDIYIQGSSINGLSSVRALNYKELNQSFGILKKLQMAGEVLLGICEYRVQPIYVGTNRMLDQSGNGQVVLSSQLLNIADELQEHAGTKHSMSVCEVSGTVYFWDAYNGKWWRYNKGLYPISDYGMAKYFRDAALAVGYETPESSWVVGGYDPKFKMPLLTFTDARNQTTVGFSEERNMFQSRYSFIPEMYAMVGQQFYSFKNGALWIFNKTGANYNNFYGSQYTPTITLAVTGNPSEMQHFWNIRVVCPAQKLILPSNTSILIPASDLFPSGMASRLKANKFVNLESRWYADILRDLSDTAEPFASMTPISTRQLNALISGRYLRGEVILLKFEPETNNAYFALYEVNTEVSLSHITK